LTLGAWLQSLPAAEQCAHLGQTKGRLFRAGALTKTREMLTQANRPVKPEELWNVAKPVCMKQLPLDPKIFNYLILTLYALNALRWGIDRKIADVCYWLSAFAITATVTFLYKH
jgi:hypothetical protein